MASTGSGEKGDRGGSGGSGVAKENVTYLLLKLNLTEEEEEAVLDFSDVEVDAELL